MGAEQLRPIDNAEQFSATNLHFEIRWQSRRPSTQSHRIRIAVEVTHTGGWNGAHMQYAGSIFLDVL